MALVPYQKSLEGAALTPSLQKLVSHKKPLEGVSLVKKPLEGLGFVTKVTRGL